MEIYDSRYFSVNKKLLSLTGLWPYQEAGTKLFIRFNILLLIFTSVLPQIIGLYLHFGVDVDKILEHIAVIFYIFIIGFKVTTMYLAENKIKIVYENIAANWQKITDNDERNILCEYSERGRLLTLGYITYMIGALIMFISLPITPILADKVFPLNETRERYYILNGEFLVDARKHYGKIYMFDCFVCTSTVFVYSAHDSIYVAIVEHCLGIYAIVKFRLQMLIKFSHQDQNYFGTRGKTNAYKWIISTIQLHKDIMEFTNILEKTFSSSFLIIIGANTASVTFTSILVLINLGDTMEMCRHSMILIGLLMHLFYVSWPGQKVIDHSSGIFQDAYNNEWYNGTKEVKNLLRFMTLRCIQPCQLTCGGIYVLNFTNFAAVLKTSASYITVFSSFR